jgi:hypothetical protein
MLKLDGTDLDDLKNVTIIQVAPLRQTTLPEAVISRFKSKINYSEYLNSGIKIFFV